MRVIYNTIEECERGEGGVFIEMNAHVWDMHVFVCGCLYEYVCIYKSVCVNVCVCV